MQLVKTTTLFAVGYQKPQQTHNVQPVKTIPLFAVRYLQPHQPPDAQQVKPHVRRRIPEATADS
uniref:Uncharacterized protein n=1 Tax=Klebsiella pneumoniae subsp. pneumoniae TaxID=72407 RepID=A0A8F7KSR0_KLEPN|nr:hypothetical protein [Klebsiella pneumoniae subsp. pneumoniae]URZ92394.1 hypothetical protein [Klebsiella pneumoniae]URZ92963.1 hypothetical protein [Klebsiella pneumoniae]URZ92965.1 hypothetical protein [Klebsiella pneumoniae]URZ93371.1 hypothetical protein [Klebsiella pneumoniae]